MAITVADAKASSLILVLVTVIADPIEIRRVAGYYWDGNQLGKFVRMQPQQSFSQRFDAVQSGFDQQQDLGIIVQCTLPAIDRTQSGNDIDASGKSFLNQRACDLRRSVSIRTGAIQQMNSVWIRHGERAFFAAKDAVNANMSACLQMSL